MVTRSDIRFTIYSKPQCPNCSNAKLYCEAQGIDYEVKMLDVDFTREEILEKFPNVKSFPIVSLKDTFLGGYYEMMEIHKKMVT